MMSTAIFIAGCVIAGAINPEMEMNTFMNNYIIFFIVYDIIKNYGGK